MTVREVRPDDGSPNCHVCGSIMLPDVKGHKCVSCGEATEPSGPAPSVVESNHHDDDPPVGFWGYMIKHLSPQASPEPRATLLSLLKHLETFILVREGHQQEYEEVMAAILRESRVTAPVGQLSIESAETIAVTLVEEVLKLQRQGYTHYCKSNVARMLKAGVDAALASPPQIAQPDSAVAIEEFIYCPTCSSNKRDLAVLHKEGTCPKTAVK